MIGGWFGRSTTRDDELNIRFFRYETLRIATNNFSTILGRGGFGSVFKGVLPGDGRTVAIKILTRPYDGFLEMVGLLSHTRHKNIIQVIGCCIANNQQLLVCEFAENGSVWDCLHGVNTSQLDWKMRASVCIGTARGLSYLHHEVGPRIIHCDIKPSNILLDANFVPKIVDFDLIYVYAEGEKQTAADRAEFSHLGVEYFDTYITTDSVKGTLGYLDPSFMCSGQLTETVDVYSFGVVMLEIITGRPPFDFPPQITNERMLLNWVKSLKRDGMVLNIVDPKLTSFPEEEVERFINVALLCTRAIQEQRPTMFEVVHMLYGRLVSDQDISKMSDSAVTDELVEGSFSTYGVHSRAVYNNSLTSSLASSSSLGIDQAADTELREEPNEVVHGYSDSFIVLNYSKGECSSAAAALAPIETSLASEEEQSCPEDAVKRSEEERSGAEPNEVVHGYSVMDMSIAVSLYNSLTSKLAGSIPIGTDYAAYTDLREEPDEMLRGYSDSFIVLNHSKGECSASAAVLAPMEKSLASEEEPICPEDVMKRSGAADTELREKPDEPVRGYSDSFIVLNHSEGEYSASAAALAPIETSLAIFSEEERSCPKDLVRAYYSRSMEKIMRYQVGKRRNTSDRTTVMTQTMVVNKSPGNMFPESVYPPFLSGEYRSARVLYSGWPAPS